MTFPASPGAWVVHSEGSRPLYTEGDTDYGRGLEHIAEDGNPATLEENSVLSGQVFSMPVGSADPGPVVPGSSHESSFDARPGAALVVRQHARSS